jgi:hypothetical protein
MNWSEVSKPTLPLPTANARSEYGIFLIDKEYGFK